MIRRAAILLPLALVACKTAPAPEQIRTVTVNVPVRQPCVPASIGVAPDYPDSTAALRAAADAAERYLLLFAGRELRNARLNELETVIQGCK